jgi:hypothetical protein
VPRAGAQCAQAAQRVWFQDGSAPAAVSPELERDAQALLPDDSGLAVPQADVPFALAVQLALRVQWDGSALAVVSREPEPEQHAPVLQPDDLAAPQEQRAAHSQRAAPDGSRVDSRAPMQAAPVAQQQAGWSVCPSLASQVSPEAQPLPPDVRLRMLPDANSPLAACPAGRRDALPWPVAARQTKAEVEAESSSQLPADSPLPPEAQLRVLR